MSEVPSVWAPFSESDFPCTGTAQCQSSQSPVQWEREPLPLAPAEVLRVTDLGPVMPLSQLRGP